ncbi:MAG: hypothetical protein M0037_01530 [Betaproteobacteria bacterium]|nr:hypothetical protein [Betaproteobacteria bacterium]
MTTKKRTEHEVSEVDDDSTGLWKEKRDLVRSGQRTQESMFFIPALDRQNDEGSALEQEVLIGTWSHMVHSA